MVSRDAQIREIMSNFDFNRVRLMMHAVGWTWGMGSSAERPTEEGLKELAQSLLQDVANGAVGALRRACGAH